MLRIKEQEIHLTLQEHDDDDLFYAQDVSDINTSIIRSSQLFYSITTLVVFSFFDLCWSFGVAGLGWYPCSMIRPATRIPPVIE